jgi:hypothetical protein
MRIGFYLAMAFTLSGCGGCNRSLAYLKGYETTCVNGVEYLQFPSGASVAYDKDGKVKRC